MNPTESITLRGYITKDTSGRFERILLEQDGYKTDLVSRVAEACLNFGENVQVNYYLTDGEQTKESLDERMIRKLAGAVDAEYEEDAYAYSSWTSGVDYNTNLVIGGHDLFTELSGEVGRYLVITFNFSK